MPTTDASAVGPQASPDRASQDQDASKSKPAADASMPIANAPESAPIADEPKSMPIGDASTSTDVKSTKPKRPTKQTKPTTPRAHASRPRTTTGRRAGVTSRAADYSSSAQGGVPPSEPTPPTVFVAEVVDDLVDEVVEKTPTPTRRMRRPVTRAAASTVESVTTTEIVPVDVGPSAGLRVLMIASEAVPFAKTGGLADVAGALPIALGRLGHDVTLVLPRYRGVEAQGAPIASLDLPLGPDRLRAVVYETRLGHGARAWLVDAPSLYDREGLYGSNHTDHPDNPLRFAFLSRAALEAARAVEYAPDLVHAHDWQGGLAPVYLKTLYARDRLLGGVPSVFTIHNISYTGTFDPSWMPALDLGWDLFRPESLEYWSRISFLKAGINFSAKVTTVSPTYAREILTPEFAYGFEGILAARRGDLVGILNGIDADIWNPATDPHIPEAYSSDDLAGKRVAKRALLEAYGLPWDDEALEEPLIGMVSRMIDQKGLDLIASIAHELPTVGARFVVLGTGEPTYEEMWRSLANDHPDRIAVRVGFDEPLSHLVEAGADLFLMPSHYEPCGLNQMYSLRYGTLPLVRATGGLDDTVENYDPYSGRGNGFKFWEASGPALLSTLLWALRVYDRPDVWQRLQHAGMQADFSWSRSAGEYARLYQQVLAAAGRRVRVAL